MPDLAELTKLSKTNLASLGEIAIQSDSDDRQFFNDNFEESVSDSELGNDSSSYRTIATVDDIHRFAESERYEEPNYLFVREEGSLSVIAKDGRGEILSVRDGQIADNSWPQDRQSFADTSALLGFSDREFSNERPTVDALLNSESSSLKTVNTVNHFLDLTGEERFDGDKYIVDRDEDNLTVTAKDGRGEILSVQEKQIVDSFEPEDRENFQAAVTLLESSQLENSSQDYEISE